MLYELKFPKSNQFSDDEFFEFCQQNKNLQFEKTKEGRIIVMSPTGSETGNRNTQVLVELEIMNRQNKSGKVFDSSTGFKLPNGATRSPDASWVGISRWNVLTKEEKKKFAPLCPDFMVELMSESDDLKESQEKMSEWMENGCQLGWLINPEKEEVYIYCPKQKPELITDFDKKLAGEKILPGFELDLGLLV